MDDDMNKLFAEEAGDQLDAAEEALLKYEKDPNSTYIEDAFRALHTIKGAAYMFDMLSLGNYAHKIENILDGVREQLFELDSQKLPIILNCLDLLKQFLQDPQLDGKDLRAEISDSSILLDDWQEEINELNRQKRADVEKPLFSAEPNTEESENLNTYYLLIEPKNEVSDGDGHPMHDIIAEFKSKEFCYVTTHHKKLDEDGTRYTEQIKHWDLYLATTETYEELEVNFIFYEDDFNIKIHHIANYNLLTEDKVLERIKKNQEADEKEDISALKKTVKSLEDQLKEQNETDNKKDSQQQNKRKQKYLRVPTHKIEKLINGISELVTAKSTLDNFRKTFNHSEFTGVVEHIQNVTDELRDTVLSVSLVPLDSLLVKFKRLVSDTARELEKSVTLHSPRIETEMDKKMIDAISDPLMHLFRNCVDHGIESPDERIKKGKPEQGNIFFESYYLGSNIVISIRDDGAGMDLAKIRNKAIEKNIIDEDTSLTDDEIKDLIFSPGFSTASKITGVSGRGVGMDVVKTNLKEVNGSIRIETEKDVGTSFIINLPLTLSIIDGLHTTLANTSYIFPLNHIQKIERLKRDQLMEAQGVLNNTVVIEGEQVKVINLREYLGYEGSIPSESSLIFLTEYENKKAFMVDKVVGQIQTVIKPLGEVAKNADYLSGSTILGDGSVGLVLDPNNLSNLN